MIGVAVEMGGGPSSIYGAQALACYDQMAARLIRRLLPQRAFEKAAVLRVALPVEQAQAGRQLGLERAALQAEGQREAMAAVLLLAEGA